MSVGHPGPTDGMATTSFLSLSFDRGIDGQTCPDAPPSGKVFRWRHGRDAGSGRDVTDVVVTPLEPGRFRAEVTEGHLTTSHRVIVPPGLLDRVGLAGADEERVVQETMRFLLEREPATSILPEFSLDDVPRFFQDFYEELRRRLST